jgi:hypothetical protein
MCQRVEIALVMHQSIPAATIPPPPGQCGAFVTLTCPHGRAFAATFSPGGRAFVNIGLLPPDICRSQRKDCGHEFPLTLLYAKMETIKYLKQILYNILLNVGFQV